MSSYIDAMTLLQANNNLQVENAMLFSELTSLQANIACFIEETKVLKLLTTSM